MVKLQELGLSGLIVFLVVVIGHPLWLSLNGEWVIWGTGIGLLVVSGALSYFNRYKFLQILLGLWGFAWTILFFFEVFPSFSISLI